MNAVLDDAVKTAIHLLEKNGEFFPFAVVKTARREIRHVQTRLKDERPASDQVIESLRSGLRKAALSGECIVIVIISDVRLTERQTGAVMEAIRAEVESDGAAPVTCYLPYSLDDGALTLGTLRAEVGTPLAFTKDCKAVE